MLNYQNELQFLIAITKYEFFCKKYGVGCIYSMPLNIQFHDGFEILLEFVIEFVFDTRTFGFWS